MSPLNAFFTQWGFRALSLYPPARDYVMQMKYKPKPRFDDGLVVHGVGAELCGRMFIQPMVETEAVRQVALDDLLGNGFALIELDQPGVDAAPVSTLPLRRIRVIRREERFVAANSAASSGGATCVRDVSGAIERTLSGSGVRAVVLRPDRYVAAGVAIDAAPGETDRVLQAVVALSQRGAPTGAQSAPVEIRVEEWQPGS